MARLSRLGVAPFASNVYVNRDFPLPTSEVKCILVSAREDAQRKLQAAGMGCACNTKPKQYRVPLGYYKHQTFVLPTSSRIRSKLGYYERKRFVLPTSSHIRKGLGMLGQDDDLIDIAAGTADVTAPGTVTTTPTLVANPNYPGALLIGGQSSYGPPPPGQTYGVGQGPAVGPVTPSSSNYANPATYANAAAGLVSSLVGSGSTPQQQSALASLTQPIAGIGLSPLALGGIALGGILLVVLIAKR